MVRLTARFYVPGRTRRHDWYGSTVAWGPVPPLLWLGEADDERVNESNIFLGDYVGRAGGRRRFYAVFTAALKRSKLGAGRQADIFGAVSR